MRAHFTVLVQLHAWVHMHELFSFSPCAWKRNITRSTAFELLKLINGSGASVEELVLCGLSCERRAVVSAGSAEGVEG